MNEEKQILFTITQLVNKPVDYIYIAMFQFETVSGLSYAVGVAKDVLDYEEFGLTEENDDLISNLLFNYVKKEAKTRNVNFLFWEYEVSSGNLTEETLIVKDEKAYLDIDFDDLTHSFFAEALKKLNNTEKRPI